MTLQRIEKMIAHYNSKILAAEEARSAVNGKSRNNQAQLAAFNGELKVLSEVIEHLEILRSYEFLSAKSEADIFSRRKLKFEAS